jgi:hypothetical protein
MLLVYYEKAKLMVVKSFITLATGGSNRFYRCSTLKLGSKGKHSSLIVKSATDKEKTFLNEQKVVCSKINKTLDKVTFEKC